MAATAGLTKLIFSIWVRYRLADGRELQLHCGMETLKTGDANGARVLSSIASLSTLRQLYVQGPVCLGHGQVTLLTSLTGLTRLTLRGLYEAAGDAAAAAVAGSMQQLELLEQAGCHLPCQQLGGWCS